MSQVAGYLSKVYYSADNTTYYPMNLNAESIDCLAETIILRDELRRYL